MQNESHMQMGPVRHYRDLVVWQQSLNLVSETYRITQTFPSDERFGLTAQIRRAAVSVPSNIAEGQGRCSTGEFRQFLGNARGSLLELETQLLIAHKLGYLLTAESAAVGRHIEKIGRMLNALLNSLTDRRNTATSHESRATATSH